MKTAMQELLERFKTMSSSGWFSFDEVEQEILDFGIPKEKQQIIDAYVDGVYHDAKMTPHEGAQNYYNETYGGEQ